MKKVAWFIGVWLGLSGVAAAQVTEGFESGLPTTAPSSATNYTLGSGVWTILKGVRSTTKHGGTYALNLNNGTSTNSTADAPAASGVSTVTFWARGSGASTLRIDKSVNGGAFTSVATQNISSSFASYTVTLNESASVRVRFRNSTSQTHYIDDVVINGTGSTTPTPTPTTPRATPTTPRATPTATARARATATSTATVTPTPTTTPTPTPTGPTPRPDGNLIGFAAVNAWGQATTTGGAGGATVTVTTAADFLAAIASPDPLIIRVSGTISLPGPMHDVASNKSILGVGSNATLTGGGLNIGILISDAITSPPANAIKNVIVRNLTITNCPDDCINVQMFSHHVWIDHNDLSDQYDGALDVKRGSSYVTISWNRFHNSDKNMLLGRDDGDAAQDVGRLKVTYHHNFLDGSSQRNPRVRFGEPVHIFNNYYLNISGYGAASQMNAGLLVENNYFDNVEKPTRTDVGGDPGRIVARGNVNVNTEDPIVVTGSVQEASGYYSYSMDAAANVPSIVSSGAGVGKVTF